MSIFDDIASWFSSIGKSKDEDKQTKQQEPFDAEVQNQEEPGFDYAGGRRSFDDGIVQEESTYHEPATTSGMYTMPDVSARTQLPRTVKDHDSSSFFESQNFDTPISDLPGTTMSSRYNAAKDSGYMDAPTMPLSKSPWAGKNPTVSSDKRAVQESANKEWSEYFASNDEPFTNTGYNDYFDSLVTGSGEEIIDNGINDAPHRSSNYITGSEALRQSRALGLTDMENAVLDAIDSKPGVDDIVVSKQSLMKYGYVPYISTDDALSYALGRTGQTAASLGESSEQFWNNVSNLRRDNTDWTVEINVDGTDVTFSGKAVDDAILKATDDGPIVYDSLGNDITDAVKDGLFDEDLSMMERSDGLYDIVYSSDGQKTGVVLSEDAVNLFNKGIYGETFSPAIIESNDGKQVEVPMEMWYSMTKNPDIAERLASIMYSDLPINERQEKSAEMRDDMGANVRYGILSAPGYESSTLINSPKDWSKHGVFGNNPIAATADGLLSSAAYLNPYTLWTRAGLAEVLSAQGVNATSQNTEDNGLITYDPARSNAANISMGIAAPFAESFIGSLGNVGGKSGWLERPVEHLIDNTPFLNNFFGRTFVGKGLPEAGEEVITEPLYDLQENGLLGLFANDSLADDGLTYYDEFGRNVLDEDTDVRDRFDNFIQTVPNNAALGWAIGSGVHGAMGLPGEIQSLLNRRQQRKNLESFEESMGY